MDLLNKLETVPIIFMGGKGGVGKTTAASALASRFANDGKKTLIISTDPAHSLGDAFNCQLSHQKTSITDYLDAIELNPDEIIHQHYKQVERTLEGYTTPDMMPKLREFLQLSQHAPGAEEAAMLEAICKHLVDVKSQDYAHIVFDTAPTGHTLRLLSLPEMMNAWTEGLLAQQKRQAQLRSASKALDKHNVVKSLDDKNQDRWQSAISVLEKRQQLFKTAREILHDKAQTAIILVLIPEALPFAETKRAVNQLEQVELSCQGIIVNQIIASEQETAFWRSRASRQQVLLTQIEQTFAHLPILKIPLQSRDVRGVEALVNLFL